MGPVSTEQVQDAIREHGVRRWLLRRCSMCDAPLYYRFFPDHVTYDSNCDCSSVHSLPSRHSYAAVAETLNRQTPEVRESMWIDMLGAAPLPAA